MNYLKISLGIFIALAASRFIPHPPNFTNLIALSFYIPLVFGTNFIPAVLASFIITDFYFGFHQVLFFTWGSIFLIGIISKYFKINIYWRFFGVISSSLIFFIVSNFGMWATGYYGYTFEGFLTTYIMAIPFYTNNLLSTCIYAIIIEIIIKFFEKNKIINNYSS
jgi:branched-subunit amino acid ABC-type transport system permease component